MAATTGTYWVSEPHQVANIEGRMNSQQYSLRPPKTVIQAFVDTVQKHGDRPALCVKIPIDVILSLLFVWFY